MTDDLWTTQRLAGEGSDAPDWAKLVEQFAGLGYWRLDVATCAIAWSDGLFAHYGLEVGDLPDLETAMAAVHPDDSERANRLVRRAMEFGEDYTDQVRLRRADGSWRVMTCRAFCRRGADGAVKTVYGAVMDITETERANEALRASEARYRLLAENGNDLIVQLDLDGHVTYMSPSSEAVTGYRPEELIGRNVGEMIDPADMADVDRAVETSLEQPSLKAGCIEFRTHHKDGREIWLESRPTPLVDPVSGEPIGITDIVRDITQRKALETELQAKCEEAQAATRAKAEFLANMSHEIRTPLTAIMGFSGLLEGLDGLPETASAYVRKICTAGEQLLGVVNDVLDFSKLDAGQVELVRQPVDPAAFVAETVDILSGQAAAKGLTLEARVGPDMPAWVLLDPGRVRQVIFNLIGNAIKFTPSGSVAVVLEPLRGESLMLVVTDTGPGIAPELQAKLFERFSQVDGSISRDHGGAGLGLAICKGLVELMGGAIGVESAPGQGSTFWFTIAAPATEAPVAAHEADPGSPAGAAHILIVDDLAVNRHLVRAMLEPLGHTFVEAANGQEGVHLAARQRFDLILMDLQMPGMDGLEAARAIRSSADFNRQSPIVALSANVLAEQIAECREAGIDDHLAKPIVPAALVAAIAKWTSRRHAARPSAAA